MAIRRKLVFCASSSTNFNVIGYCIKVLSSMPFVMLLDVIHVQMCHNCPLYVQYFGRMQ